MRSIPIPILIVALLAACKGDRARVDPMVEMAKRCSHDAELSCPVPIYSVQSLADSQRYYRDALGFKVEWDHGDPPTFGAVSRGHMVLFMCQQCQGHPGTWAMVFARDVNRLHEELVRRDAIIRMPPTDMPWGLREMHVADPDGNVIRFASAIEHDD